jgi:hypothetical protein
MVQDLSQLSQLRAIWQEQQSSRAEGGLLAISGFEHQFLLALLKVVRCWKELPEAERQNLQLSQRVLTEALSDIVEIGVVVTLTQVKRTLSKTMLSSALKELWEIFKIASEHTPNLLDHLRFVISGKFEGERSAEEVIQGWGKKSQNKQTPELADFKKKVSCELVADPRADLRNELEKLGRDEDAGATISRWLGYLLQLGSGFPPERISSFIWRELANDQGLAAFSTTLARLLSQSQKRLHALRGTLGQRIALPRTELSQLQEYVFSQTITLLCGSSGSGKSVLCKLAIQQCFQDFDCLFLNPADVVAFSEAPDVVAGRGLRRLDELFTARIIENPVLIIDDLSDVDEQSLNTVLDLIHTSLNFHTDINIRFVLVSHPSGEDRIREKLSARFGTDLSLPVVELPQLPIQALNLTENLPVGIADLIQRHDQFGPALNLKLLDWLIRSVQEKQVDVSQFKSDLDLLNWFWRDHIGIDRNFSESCRALIRIAEELADRFTPDLPLYFDSSIRSDVLSALIRKDCLRVADERIAVSHRFVGDCARFHSLRSNRREIETSSLVEKLMNPLWAQPVRWFALQSVMESEGYETWQETVCDALEGDHLQLLDSFLDGAILSKQPGAVLRECPGEHLPLIIERFIIRLLAIATIPFHYEADDPQSIPLRIKLTVQEQVTGTPKPQLWEPAWRWLLSQNPDDILEESCIIFKAAHAWLNWSADAKKFPLRTEVAEFILDLAQRVLLPDPDPSARTISGAELDELVKLRQQGILPDPEPSRKKRYHLGDFKSKAFSCVVFTLRIIPKRSTWLLRALAGREIIPANRLAPTETSGFLSRPGIGVLEPSHPKGPAGGVNRNFREFMLNQNGFYLTTVILVNSQLGAELLLALTIRPPRYRYESDWNDDWRRDSNLGTEGSYDLDVCTFNFAPLLTLLQLDEETAIGIVDTLCQVAAQRNREVCESLYRQREQSVENLEADRFLEHLQPDAYELSLIIDRTNKQFQGERKSLYWHRNSPLSPKIVNCLLMTLEAWLYSRPTRIELERSIAIILERSSTVAMLGVLVTLAKCDPSLLTGALLPLVSSLQLLIWLEFELIDQGQDYGFDSANARKLSQADREKLLEFQQLPYRKIDLRQRMLSLWISGEIPSEVQLRVLENWDSYQLSKISEVSASRASRIRAWFERSNWQEGEDSNGNPCLQFVGEIIPRNLEEDDSPLWNLQHLQVTVTCRKIIDGEQEKTLELHNSLVGFLTNEEQIDFLKQKLEPTAFRNIIWASIAIILAPPHQELTQELEVDLEFLTESLANLSFAVDSFSRCQRYGLDSHAFIAHVAPELIKRLSTDSEIRIAAFRSLIGVSNEDTSAFVRSWLKTYGLKHPLTQPLINVASRIARLISLTYVLAYARYIRKATRTDGTYIAPHSQDIADEICHSEDPQTEEAWLNLQNNFVEDALQTMSITNAFGWTPEALSSSIQEVPDWLLSRSEEALDWEFLGAVLIPVLKAKVEDAEDETFIIELGKQVIAALVCDRDRQFSKRQSDVDNHWHSDIQVHLYESQNHLLDAAVEPDNPNFLAQVNYIVSTLRGCNLVDCIMLCGVIDVLIYRFIDRSATEEHDGTLINEMTDAIGAYLFELRNRSMPDLRVLGRINDAWEKLIELLSQDSRQVNGVACADQSLVRFLQRFQEGLLSCYQARQKLYDLGKASQYKQLRRVLLKILVQRSDLIPMSRDTESESLVQLLAELWDCDRNWVMEKQVRLQDLRTLLGQLQQADAAGAGALADQIAHFLAH